MTQKVSNIPVSLNQIEFHPWLYQKEILNYCKENDIAVTAAAPLDSGGVLEDDLVNELAEKYDKAPAQIILRWDVQKGVAAVSRSSSRQHIKENFQVFNWGLESKDVKKLDQISKRERTYMIDLDDEIYRISS